MATRAKTSILVTGGTGALGRHVVARLLEAGREVRVLTRRGAEDRGGVEFVQGDLATGEGVDLAVPGAETILHLAGSSKGDTDKARHLLDAASRARTPHVVYISVVGADRIPVESAIDRAMFGYFAEKATAERMVAESGLPWTTLRATQFHELFLDVAEKMSKAPVMPYPSRFRFQPIAADEVAERLVELALGPPAGLVPEIGGPRVHGMDQILRTYLSARGKHRLLVPFRAPGRAARAFREGANLTHERPVRRMTWEEFLSRSQLGREGSSHPVATAVR